MGPESRVFVLQKSEFIGRNAHQLGRRIDGKAPATTFGYEPPGPWQMGSDE